MFFKKKEEIIELDERLIIYNTEQSTIDIYYVTHVDHESVACAGYVTVPKSDCTVANSPEGLVYVYKADDIPMIATVERLAELEQSIVLSQITAYTEPKKDNPNLDLKFWGVAIALIIAIIF